VIYSFVLCSWNLEGWATAIGEFLIAGVIYWELEETRRAAFETEATNRENYEARGCIYSRFFDVEGTTLAEKSETFRKLIWEDPQLRGKCERNIVLFSRLGQMRRYTLFHRRAYMKLFPHAVVLFWMMLQPFIEERRRLTGERWASDFKDLTAMCLGYLLENPEIELCLFDSDRKRKSDFKILRSDLLRLQGELTSAKRK
jgi:hypothetical protein